MILILGHPDDQHARYVCDAVRENGSVAEILDTSCFPSQVRISVDPLDVAASTLRLHDRGQWSWEEIDSVYWRQYQPVGDPGLSDLDQTEVATNDSRSLIESFLRSLPAHWVNGWDAYQFHQTKTSQLIAVAELDLPAAVRLPKTCVGNDPQAVLDFVEASGSCILKPAQGGAHTTELEPRHLSRENLENLSRAPVTIQEKIEGTDIRVFVAGERVMACAIHSKSLDFRDDPGADIQPVTLPNEVSDSCLRIAKRLHLVWTGIDLRLQPDGQYVFFEANPSPMFLGFEKYSGLPLSEALMDLLLGRFENGR